MYCFNTNILKIIMTQNGDAQGHTATGALRAALMAPGVLVMAAGFLLPLAIAVWLSIQGQQGLSLEAWNAVLQSTLFWRVVWNTLQISFLSTVAAILLGYPIAFHLSRRSGRQRQFLLLLVLIPFWTSILVKSYAFIVILGREGLLNQSLQAIWPGLAPLDLLFNRTGLAIGMAHQIVPFAVLPILASLVAIDAGLVRAARVMGASEATIFARIILPLSLPGVLAAFLLVFTVGLGAYITPALLGGERDIMIANLIDLRLRDTLDWAAASAIAIALALTVAVFITLSRQIGVRVRGA